MHVHASYSEIGCSKVNKTQFSSDFQALFVEKCRTISGGGGLRGGEPGRTGSHNGQRAPGAPLWDHGADPALVAALADDLPLDLDLLDGDGVVVDPEHADVLTGRGTHHARESRAGNRCSRTGCQSWSCCLKLFKARSSCTASPTVQYGERNGSFLFPLISSCQLTRYGSESSCRLAKTLIIAPGTN